MNVEVICTTVKENHSATVKVTEQMDRANESKIQEMKDVIKAFWGSEGQKQLEVRCFPDARSPATTSSTKPSTKSSDSPKRISSDQIGYLLSLLKRHNISVNDFCRQHGINQVEEMSMKEARDIINELKCLQVMTPSEAN